MSSILGGDILATASDNSSVDQDRTDGDEAACLVALIADQVTAAVDEAFHEIDALSRSFLETAQQANKLLDAVDDLSTGSGKPHPLQSAVQEASIRLQFADRLHQRLSNVSKNLMGFAELIQTTELPIESTAWATFLEKMRATFTMEQERQMFDEVIRNDR